MNIIELQENFEKACLYYAVQFEPVPSFQRLMEANLVRNPTPDANQPNYFKVITKWNHSSRKPTDENLLAFTVAQVQNYYDSIRDDIEESTRFKIFIDGAWKEVLLKPIG